jgi:hypothetical protein
MEGTGTDRLTHEAKLVQQQHARVNEGHVERLDGRVVLLRDQRFHHVVDGVVAPDAVGEALEAEFLAAGEVGRGVGELSDHECARDGALVVAQE